MFNRRFCGNGVPDWVPQPPEFNFPYPIEVEYEVDENGYPSRWDTFSTGRGLVMHVTHVTHVALTGNSLAVVWFYKA